MGTQFYEIEPTIESQWRSVILFGRNVASYKFALGKALLELAGEKEELVKLDALAGPFARHLCEHLARSDKQSTAASSQFLDACRRFNRSELAESELIETTVKLGFANVIDAFHVVGRGEIPLRFFVDERRESQGIRITEELRQLSLEAGSEDFPLELEARWRLVETAWDLGITRRAVIVDYEPDLGLLAARTKGRRTNVTSCRHALNGYQKARCFFCFDVISIAAGAASLADVDHFFPHVLKETGVAEPIDGIWNLVLACRSCNRGEGGKSYSVPVLSLVERLHHRNDYLIRSHHPLRETLLAQTGPTERARRQFLQNAYTGAKERLIHTWCPDPKGSAMF